MKYHRLSALNTDMDLPSILEVKNTKIKVSVVLVSSEASLPALFMTTISLSLLLVFYLCVPKS